MGRKKLAKFAELNALTNVWQPTPTSYPVWRDHCQSLQPWVVELGCGRGDYTVSLAQQHPEQHYLGIDIQGERLWYGAQQALVLQLHNAWFLRIPIEQLADYFMPGELSEIWLTFPDPYPRDKQAKKRLTSPRFLSIYQQLLIPGGKLHLKTDNLPLFNYSLTSVQISGATLMQRTNLADDSIQTHFERKYRAHGKPIYYAQWQWPTNSSDTV